MRRSPTPFESLQRDKSVYEELVTEASSRRKFPRVETLGEGQKAIVKYLEHPHANQNVPLESSERLPEAIILAEGRPTLLVRENTFEEPHLNVWKERLEKDRSTLNQVIPSVGRVEVVRHPDFEWLGTAWVIDERILVTNRHVASLFAKRQGSEYRFLKNPFGEAVGSRIDFREEFEVAEMLEINVEKVLFIADVGQNHPDIAFLLLSDHGEFPNPIALAKQDPEVDDPVAVIGYPAFDTRNSGVLMSRIFSDIFDVKRLAPGFVSFNEERSVFEHDCTTLGGNSGSPVVNIESGEAVGLHFSGRFGVANFAVKASVVRESLGRVSGVTTAMVGDVGEDERRMRPSDYEGRKGYDERFLGRSSRFHVPLPELSPDQLDDAVYVTGARGRGLSRYVLDYTHFSLVMCKSRRLAYFTAVNIDGTQEVLLRRQNTSWVFDGRIPERFQAGNDVYRRNDADRGHLVRRLDPVWGTDEVARQADEDTFHYTNAAPQHRNLNQRTWLALEDYLLRNAANRDLKITVFTGPVFQPTDVLYRGLKIPEEFWKVVAMVTPNGQIHTTAYLLSQRELVDDFEFAFGRFRTFQTSVRRIEEKAGIRFGSLRDTDPLKNSESLSEVLSSSVVSGPESIVV